MPRKNSNLRFEVILNGKHQATAGFESCAVMSFIASVVHRDPKMISEQERKSAIGEDWDMYGKSACVRLGGLDVKTDQHVEWFRKILKAGDRVVIRVLPPGEFDSPQPMRADRKRRVSKK